MSSSVDWRALAYREWHQPQLVGGCFVLGLSFVVPLVAFNVITKLAAGTWLANEYLVGIVLSGIGISAASSWLYVYSKRLRARDAWHRMAQDPRPPVLLLRAFRDDQMHIQSLFGEETPFLGFPVRRTFDEAVTEILARKGPVVAIGRPGESVPPLGAGRLWVSDDLWQKVIDGMLNECRYVAMVIGNLSAGLEWEARRVFGLADKRKVIILMPPVPEEEAARRWAAYSDLSCGLLPPYVGGEILATFDEEDRCKVTRDSDKLRSEDAYWGALSAMPGTSFEQTTALVGRTKVGEGIAGEESSVRPGNEGDDNAGSPNLADAKPLVWAVTFHPLNWQVALEEEVTGIVKPVGDQFESEADAEATARRMLREKPGARVFVCGPKGLRRYRVLP